MLAVQVHMKLRVSPCSAMGKRELRDLASRLPARAGPQRGGRTARGGPGLAVGSGRRRGRKTAARAKPEVMEAFKRSCSLRVALSR